MKFALIDADNAILQTVEAEVRPADAAGTGWIWVAMVDGTVPVDPETQVLVHTGTAIDRDARTLTESYEAQPAGEAVMLERRARAYPTLRQKIDAIIAKEMGDPGPLDQVKAAIEIIDARYPLPEGA